jgi:hypothetical protein
MDVDDEPRRVADEELTPILKTFYTRNLQL